VRARLPHLVMVLQQPQKRIVRPLSLLRHVACISFIQTHCCFVTMGRTLVERMNSISGRLYRDDATIFAWDLVNEPRCETWRVRQRCAMLLICNTLAATRLLLDQPFRLVYSSVTDWLLRSREYVLSCYVMAGGTK